MFQKAYTVACGKKLWLRIIPADRSIEMLDFLTLNILGPKIPLYFMELFITITKDEFEVFKRLPRQRKEAS